MVNYSLLPTVSIIMTTYLRTNLALQTLHGLFQYLKYSGNLFWIIADDGSSQEHRDILRNYLEGQQVSFLVLNAYRKGVGVSKNNALRKAFEISPIILLIEDDWVLEKELDITSDVRILINFDDVGIIRYGFLSEGTRMKLCGYEEILMMELEKNSCFYIYSGQVSLRHQRFYDMFGYHLEGCSPGEEEIEFCLRYNNSDKFLKILWRADLPVLWGPFKNVGFNMSLNEVHPE